MEGRTKNTMYQFRGASQNVGTHLRKYKAPQFVHQDSHLHRDPCESFESHMFLHPNDDTLFNDTLNNKLTKLMFRVRPPTKTLKLFSSPWTAFRWLAHILGTSDCFPTKTRDNNVTTSYFIHCEVQSNLDTAPLFSTAMWHYIAGGGKSNYFIVRISMCVERGAISGFDCISITTCLDRRF